jgi:hypothetical protein
LLFIKAFLLAECKPLTPWEQYSKPKSPEDYKFWKTHAYGRKNYLNMCIYSRDIFIQQILKKNLTYTNYKCIANKCSKNVAKFEHLGMNDSSRKKFHS